MQVLFFELPPPQLAPDNLKQYHLFWGNWRVFGSLIDLDFFLWFLPSTLILRVSESRDAGTQAHRRCIRGIASTLAASCNSLLQETFLFKFSRPSEGVSECLVKSSTRVLCSSTVQRQQLRHSCVEHLLALVRTRTSGGLFIYKLRVPTRG